MTSIYNCDQSELVEKTSAEIKKISSFKPPVWAAFVKTGMHKERPPASNDWWYARAASVLRQIYRYGPIGVSKLRNKYGGKKNRGYKPEHFYKGSGNILRKILQQLEAAGFVKKEDKGIHKGRILTAEGKKFLDAIASKISKHTPQQTEHKKEAKKEEKKQEEEKAETIQLKTDEKTKQPKTKEEKKSAKDKKETASKKDAEKDKK